MVGKDYKLEDNADLFIVFHVTLTEGNRINLNQIPYRGNTVTLPSLEALYEAELLVNAIDVSDERVVWKAFTTKDILNIDIGGVDEARLSHRIGEIFESFPERVNN